MDKQQTKYIIIGFLLLGLILIFKQPIETQSVYTSDCKVETNAVTIDDYGKNYATWLYVNGKFYDSWGLKQSVGTLSAQPIDNEPIANLPIYTSDYAYPNVIIKRADGMLYMFVSDNTAPKTLSCKVGSGTNTPPVTDEGSEFDMNKCLLTINEAGDCIKIWHALIIAGGLLLLVFLVKKK